MWRLSPLQAGPWNGGVLRNQVVRAVLLEVAPLGVEGDGGDSDLPMPRIRRDRFRGGRGDEPPGGDQVVERDSRQQGRLDRCEGDGEGQARGDSGSSQQAGPVVREDAPRQASAGDSEGGPDGRKAKSLTTIEVWACHVADVSTVRTVPLFVLPMGLFPLTQEPLRVFEPRYKQMLDDCVLGESRSATSPPLTLPRPSEDGHCPPVRATG